MQDVDYSVVIRTLGTAGEKYQKLLDSISNLVPQPKEIIVVLPEGYEVPKEQIGNETYYFSPKGMVIQRLYGIEKCKTKYALVCDDDIEFDSSFVLKLYQPIVEGKCSITGGPLYELLPKPGFPAFIDVIISGAVPSLFHRRRYISILNSSGYSYNRNLCNGRIYYTQSLPWACFFASINDLKRIKLQDEKWLDINGFAALDDQTMFYKAYLIGIESCVVPEALYKHNDAKSSTKTASDQAYYAGGFNRIVFWHRFIYRHKTFFISKLWAIICLRYNYIMYCLYYLLFIKRGKIPVEKYKLFKKGFKDGREYIKSYEYKNLSKY